MPGKRRHPAARAIIYGGILGGMSNARIDALLREFEDRPLPPSSYAAILKHYVPYFKEDMARLGAAIESPPTYSALKKAGEPIPANVDPDDDAADDE